MKLPSQVVMLLILLGFILFLPIELTHGSDLKALEPTGQTPIWRLDLHPLGFTNDEERRGEYWLTRFARPVAMTQSGDIAVIFVNFRMNSHGYVPGTSSLHFVIVNRDSGKVTSSKAWPVADGSGTPSIIATLDDHLLLYSDFSGALALYSSNLELTSSASFEKQGKVGSNWTSSDGRYFFYEVKDGSRYGLTMIETDTLKPLQSWNSDFPIAAASDRYFARWEQVKDQYRRSLYVRSQDSEWKEIYRDTGCNQASAFVQFLAQDLLLIRSCDKATILAVDGKVSFAITIPPKHDMGLTFGTSELGTSSDGKRFAISIAGSKKQPWWTGDPGYDRVHPILILYDTAGPNPVSTFTLNAKLERPSAFALSSDGSLMALLRSGFLELYRLPAKP